MRQRKTEEQKRVANRLRVQKWRDANPDKVIQYAGKASERMKAMRLAFRQLQE